MSKEFKGRDQKQSDDVDKDKKECGIQRKSLELYSFRERTWLKRLQSTESNLLFGAEVLHLHADGGVPQNPFQFFDGQKACSVSCMRASSSQNDTAGDKQLYRCRTINNSNWHRSMRLHIGREEETWFGKQSVVSK